jgi:hypothetical protein
MTELTKRTKALARAGLERIGRRLLGRTALSELDRASSATQTSQLLLGMQYREMAKRGESLPFADVEFRTFSQNGEDGILLYIFSIIGTTNRTVVDVGSGSAFVANSTNLIVNHGWNGLLLDGGEDNVRTAREFFARSMDTASWPPKVVRAWIDTENINSLLVDNGFGGSIDLWSMDLDGNDYWIWEAMTAAQPRVVVLEYLDILGADRAWTVPYDRNFVGEYDEMGLCYGGASLPAFVKLGRRKGYRLVGCQRYGYNAFFVRNDIATNLLPEVSAASCLVHAKVREGIRSRLDRVINKPWVEV